ncbi:hypothetical protein HETIRDRAFT_420937 [Heterobasidion irregulare TC 32-1]|uniref:Uncharacterized protein n=1 Tax=Heterobasidion irregulare (strain TC 32-1) TaxID=747525 RepID=W4JZ42_HETIT|nr:uncharacterized protein HETIRDRAFT_420937 [Heterobasidion irregulare TC 32-1]ETW78151.1 hypothetical protein HETIRDRAFT_420937 [Heterobasidion irregulare TC 32-1]
MSSASVRTGQAAFYIGGSSTDFPGFAQLILDTAFPALTLFVLVSICPDSPWWPAVTKRGCPRFLGITDSCC